MARTRKNPLTIIEIFGDDQKTITGYRLTGFVNGKQVRRQGPPDILPELEIEKAKIEERLRRNALLNADGPSLVKTYLTKEQIKDCEAACRLIENRNCTLLEAVMAGIAITGTTGPKDAHEAYTEYMAHMAKRRLSKYTIKTSDYRLRDFLKATGVKMLGEISPAMINAYVEKDTDNLVSRLSRGRPICTWLNWCCDKSHGPTESEAYLSASPYKIDMKELGEIAARDALGKKKMLTAAQCEKLLKAAIAYNDGELVPFVILSLWCYMRAADVMRTTRSLMHLNVKSSTEGAFIEAYGHKKGSRARSVAIPENVLPLLRQCVARGIVRPNWWLQPGQELTPALAKANEDKGDIPFSRHGWDIVREQAGLIEFSDILNPVTKNQVITESDWQANILRHTGESYAVRRKGDIASVTRSAGHSVSTAYKHYICVPRPGDTDKFYALNLALPPVSNRSRDDAEQVA